MRGRGGAGFTSRIAFLRDRPILAIAISALSLLVIVSAITFTTPLRCGPAKALGLTRIASGCVTEGSVGIRPRPGGPPPPHPPAHSAPPRPPGPRALPTPPPEPPSTPGRGGFRRGGGPRGGAPTRRSTHRSPPDTLVRPGRRSRAGFPCMRA